MTNIKDLDRRLVCFVKEQEGKPITLGSILFELRPSGFKESSIRHSVRRLVDGGALILNEKGYIRLGKPVW